MDKELIKQIVKETIEELKRSGMLKSYSETAYAEISTILKAYYSDGEIDSEISKALKGIESDPYYKIIPLFFSYEYTIEKIAEVFDVEISTIVRNKKRLCLKIYETLNY